MNAPMATEADCVKWSRMLTRAIPNHVPMGGLAAEKCLLMAPMLAATLVNVPMATEEGIVKSKWSRTLIHAIPNLVPMGVLAVEWSLLLIAPLSVSLVNVLMDTKENCASWTQMSVAPIPVLMAALVRLIIIVRHKVLNLVIILAT